MGIQERFGMRLRMWREKRNLTQVQLGDKAHLSQEYIARLESGSKANPSLEVLVRLAKALKVTVGELVE